MSAFPATPPLGAHGRGSRQMRPCPLLCLRRLPIDSAFAAAAQAITSTPRVRSDSFCKFIFCSSNSATAHAETEADLRERACVSYDYGLHFVSQVSRNKSNSRTASRHSHLRPRPCTGRQEWRSAAPRILQLTRPVHN